MNGIFIIISVSGVARSAQGQGFNTICSTANLFHGNEHWSQFKQQALLSEQCMIGLAWFATYIHTDDDAVRGQLSLEFAWVTQFVSQQGLCM